mgnify:FL=1
MLVNLSWRFGVVCCLCWACRPTSRSGGLQQATDSRLVAEQPDSIVGSMAFARLSAAGVDTIVVRRQELTGASRPVVVVSGSVIRDSIGLETDVLPSIVAFGDLNDDGWRDIVLLAEDESSALPVVVLVTAHGLAVPHPKPLDLWKTMQVTWADEGPADTCESGLQPEYANPGAGPGGRGVPDPVG